MSWMTTTTEQRQSVLNTSRVRLVHAVFRNRVLLSVAGSRVRSRHPLPAQSCCFGGYMRKAARQRPAVLVFDRDCAITGEYISTTKRSAPSPGRRSADSVLAIHSVHWQRRRYGEQLRRSISRDPTPTDNTLLSGPETGASTQSRGVHQRPSGCGDRNRTCNLRLMRPARFRCATPQ